MKAVKKFKNSLSTKRPDIMEDILGGRARIVEPPLSMSPDASPVHHRARSVDAHDRRAIEQVLATEGVHRDIDPEDFDSTGPRRKVSTGQTASKQTTDNEAEKTNQDANTPKPSKQAPHATPSARTSNSSTGAPQQDHGKGHAHDPLSDQLFLDVGPGGNGNNDDDAPPPDPPVVSESPPAADIDIYETAYHSEVERIRRMQGERATLYLTRRVEAGEACFRKEALLGKEGGEREKKVGRGVGGLAKVLEMARERGTEDEDGHENQSQQNS